MGNKNHYDGASIVIVLSLVVLDLLLWHDIVTNGIGGLPSPRVYFLDSGKTQAELLVLPGNIKILIDAGSDGTTLKSLEKILPPGDTYIDLAILSIPEADYFGGYQYILGHYRFGAFLTNGRNAQVTGKIMPPGTTFITVGRGDNIRSAGSEIAVISPASDFAHSAAPEDTALVLRLTVPAFAGLFTSGSGANVEHFLEGQSDDLAAEILVSSGTAYLAAAHARFSMIRAPTTTTEVYKRNGALQIVLYN